MDEYIEREAVVKLLKAACEECRETCEEFDGFYADCDQCIMHSVVNGVPSIPAADVVPVRHGRWIEQPHDFDLCGVAYYQCSVCGREQQTPSNYCQFCGARMDLVTDCNQVKDGDGE